MSRTLTMRVLTLTGVVIPDGLNFELLKLERFGNTVRFDYDVLRQVWIASGHAPEL